MPLLLSRPIPNLCARVRSLMLYFLYSPLAPFFCQCYKQSQISLIFAAFPQFSFGYYPVSLKSKISQECGFMFTTSLSSLLSYFLVVWVLFRNTSSYQSFTTAIDVCHIAKHKSYFSVFIVFESSAVKAKRVHHSLWKHFSFNFCNTACSWFSSHLPLLCL